MSSAARVLIRPPAGADEATADRCTEPVRRAARRVALRHAAMLILLGVAVVVLLFQAAHSGSAVAALGHANPAWVGVVAAATAGTYLAAAAAWMAAAPVPLTLRRTFAVQLAAASANRVLPAGLGGMATNIRYLRRAGSTRADAVGATALNSGAGLIVHVLGLSLAASLGGTGSGWHLPTADLGDAWPVLILVSSVLAALGAWKWATLLRPRLRPAITEIAAIARRMSARPGRTVRLLVASSGVTAGNAGALVASAYAFGSPASLAKLALIYLGGSAVSAAAPTPGGLGALDAALVAGLSAAGTPSASAVAAVLTYRAISYWLPVVPGLIAHRILRSRQVL